MGEMGHFHLPRPPASPSLLVPEATLPSPSLHFGVNAHFCPIRTQRCPHLLPAQGKFTLPCSRDPRHARSAGVTISLRDDELSSFFSLFPPQTKFWLNTALPESQIWKTPPRATRHPTIPLV